jgi:predicted pyridoxine 5'-phosphate oxidase superfamily flavin-nucleotide-binding protein
MTIIYHEGHRRLQDQFDSRRIADRLEQVTMRTAFTADDKAFIESRAFFFLATATEQGKPTCNLKGGMNGFVRVITPDVLAFPDYDGNGMFLSIGNIATNPNVGLLFIDFEKPKRLRVNGTASIARDDALMQHTVGAQLIVRVKAHAIFPNCPRYVPKMQMVEPSIYAPRDGVDPPEPAWKNFPEFKDAVHPRQETYGGSDNQAKRQGGTDE